MPIIHAAERVKKASGMDRVFFTNSGTEAIEGAIKAAKKYAYTRDGHAGHEIIAMNHSFHGRSIGALSVTGNKHYQEPFEPLMPGVKFADYNDLDSVKKRITDKTCAILFETVQGEGGIYPATKEFMEGVRKLCDEHDILLILDEIQCLSLIHIFHGCLVRFAESIDKYRLHADFANPFTDFFATAMHDDRLESNQF